MAWIYLAESQEIPLLWENGSTQLPTVKETDMLKLFSCHVCEKVLFQVDQSGTTSQPCKEGSCQGSISLSEVSPARILALQARVRDLAESEADYSLRLYAWPKKSSPLSYSLRTSQPSGPEDWTLLSKNLPRSGMTSGGRCFPLEMSEQVIKEKGGSAWPTPLTSDATGRPQSLLRLQENPNARLQLREMSKHDLWPDRPEGEKGHLNPQFVELLMGFPNDWTALNDLVTPWFLSKRGKHSKP